MAALLGVLAVVSPVAGQETVRPRTPALELRPVVTPAELAKLPADTLFREPPLRYDPWMGVVRRGPALPLGRERAPAMTGIELLRFAEAMRARQASRLLVEAWTARLSRDRRAEGLIPELEDPLQVPEPLARVFGEGSDFDVEGKLHLGAIGSRARQEPDLRSELVRRTVGGLDLELDQILDLKIAGSIGTKLDLAVDFNSSRELESKQLVTAAYTGTEDEIVKRVEVGDIDVALPPSRFLGGGVARGTFGAQGVAQLGPVDLQILGSRKEGQSSQRSLSIAPQGEGVLQEVTLEIKDTQFQDDRFFLLFHPDSLAGSRIVYPSRGTPLADPTNRPADGTLNVWLDDGNFTNNRESASKPGTAFINPTDPDTLAGQAHQGFFDLLIEGEDYVVTDGVILQLRRQLNDDETLAVSYVTEGETPVGSPQGGEELELKLIKPVNPDTLDFTWDYTLRNVYSLREPDIQLGSLELTIYRGNQELKRTFETVEGESRKYSRIFGVTDQNGRVNVPRILRDPFGGPDFLVFPDIRPFFRPSGEAGGTIELEVPNRSLYFDSDPRRTALDNQIYFIEANYLSRGGLTGEVELGASNIIEGSETISFGGVTLQRGEDYQIFYEFGRVIFNDPAGLAENNPDASLDIRFEVAPLFNLAPTSLMGTAGTWNISENAAINSTILLQDQESLANRPILGGEPTRMLIGEIDGTWARSAPFLTRWLDALPGLESDEPSRFDLRGELAWSQPDPNTEGRVFLNDFENIEVAKRVSMFFRAWQHSSRPSGTGFPLTAVADARWFTFAVRSEEITPGIRGVDQGNNLFVMRLDPTGETPGERRESWRSVHIVLSSSGDDLTRQEFVEFFVKGDRGTIVVDLGEVDEDAIRLDRNGAPVGLGVLDTEETNPDTRDNNLDVGEDTGLDGVAGLDNRGVPGDVGNDDFDETTFADGFPANPNGSEGNRILDTEDNNLNGLLDREENVLRWEIDLSDSRFVVPGSRTSAGFRQIRLPLSAPDERAGTPDLRNTRVLRLAFSGVERTTEFELANMEIVGSTFIKRGIVGADGTPLAGEQSDSLRITAINDLENPDYFSPPGVVAVQDRADEVAGISDLVREQSLDLEYTGLPPGARGAIFRPLFDRETYIDYRRMRVWVQGRPTEGGEQPEFFVAFGLDTLNVYEYGAPLKEAGWEEHVIDFGVFTELKRTLLDSLGTVDATTGTQVSEDGRYRVRIRSGSSSPPTLTDVGQLTIGVENTTGAELSGSFWIDEWRLTAPDREGGAARYVRGTTRLADLGEVGVTWENRGARYRNLSAARNNFSSDALDVSANLRLDRFLPESWGLSVPLSFNRSERDAAPLFRVGSDIELEEGTEAREEHTRTSSRQVVSLRAFRTRESQNPLLAATIDRLEARVTLRSEERGSFDLDSERERVDAHLGYRNSFRERAVPLGLGWIAGLPWPEAIKQSEAIRKLAGADLNVVPSNVTLSTQAVFEERARDKSFEEEDEFTADTTRTLTAGTRIGFRPFQSMRATLSLDDTRDLNFPETVVGRGTFGVAALRTQSVDFDWSPPVARWLTPRYSYTSRFVRNHTREASRALDSLDLRDFSVTTNQNLTLQIGPGELIDVWAADAAGRWWQGLFEPLRIEMRHGETAAYVQEEQDPGLGFSFGFGELDEAATGEPQNVSQSETFGVSSGIRMFDGLRIRAQYRTTDDERQYFQGTNEGSTRTWPDVDLRWTNIEFPGFLGRLVSRATVTSQFERRASESSTNGNLLNDADRRLWDPLFSLEIEWGNGMRTDLRAEASETLTSIVRGGAVDSRREEISEDYRLDFNYTLQPGTTLYIPFPTLWGAVLEQPLRASLTLARRLREDQTISIASGETALNLETTTTEIRPSVAYEFGRVVSGFGFSYLSREDEKRDVKNTTMSLEAFLDLLF